MRYVVYSDYYGLPDTEEVAEFESLKDAKEFLLDTLIDEGSESQLRGGEKRPFILDMEEDIVYVVAGGRGPPPWRAERPRWQKGRMSDTLTLEGG